MKSTCQSELRCGASNRRGCSSPTGRHPGAEHLLVAERHHALSAVAHRADRERSRRLPVSGVHRVQLAPAGAGVIDRQSEQHDLPASALDQRRSLRVRVERRHVDMRRRLRDLAQRILGEARERLGPEAVLDRPRLPGVEGSALIGRQSGERDVAATVDVAGIGTAGSGGDDE